jgi:hypothetical protein
MPVLPNPRQERFAQELAKGETADAAYKLAGYKPNRGNASELRKKQHILNRIAELQATTAKRAEITRESLIARLESACEFAELKSQPSALIAGLAQIAKIAGFYEPPPVSPKAKLQELTDAELVHLIKACRDLREDRGDIAIIEDEPLSEEKWAAKYGSPLQPAPAPKPLLPAAPTNGHGLPPSDPLLAEPKVAAVNPEPKPAPSVEILPPRPRRRILQ